MLKKKVKKCQLSKNKVGYIDYKDIDLLKKFMTEKGKILPAKATGTCARYQRKVTVAIKRARNMALLPFSVN